MNVSIQDEFKFYVPIDLVKSSKAPANGEMVLEGLAGSGDTDSEGENLDYEKFDTSRMFYVNWEHGTQAADVVGVIKEKQINKGKIFLKASLFTDYDKAVDIFNLQKRLESHGEHLGFSVEGKVIERDPINPKVVKKAELYGVAICKVPVNATTYAKIAKAFNSEVIEEEEEEEEGLEKMTTGDMGPAIPESVEKKKNINKDCKKVEILSKSQVYIRIFDRFTKQPSLADGIYNLIKSISKMEKKPITEDQIRKAEEILGIVSETSAGSDVEEIKKSELTGPAGDMAPGGDTQGGNISVLKKSMDKAKEEYELKKAKYEELAKGFPAKEGSEDDDDQGKEEKIEKSVKIGAIGIDLLKSTLIEVLGDKLAFVEKLEKAVQLKTNALASLIVHDREQLETLSNDLKKANDSIETITQFNSDLRQRLHVVEQTPIRKGVTVESYKERFTPEKSTENQFSLKRDKDRLVQYLNDSYGSDMNKSENISMLEVAATLEMAGTLMPSQVNLLKSKGIEVIA